MQDFARWLQTASARVKEFHERVTRRRMPPRPILPTPDELKWLVGALREEVRELDAAARKGDVAGYADGLVDLLYFAVGGLLTAGVPPGPAFDAVHTANMSKVRAAGTRGEGSLEGDAAKPDGWSPPDWAWLGLPELNMRLETLARMSPVHVRAAELRAQRGASYNAGGVALEDHFPLGDASYFQMCYTKIKRLQSLLGRAPYQLEDSAIDLVNYATFWVEYLNKRMAAQQQDVVAESNALLARLRDS